MVSNRTVSSAGRVARIITPSNDAKEGQVSGPGHSASLPLDYDTLNFKEMLAACPLDEIELTRVPEFPRDTEFDPAD